MGSLSIWHWAIVLLVVVLLFGSKRLPDATRNLGRSLRILKSEVREMQTDAPAAAQPQPPAPAPLPPAAAPTDAVPPQPQPQQHNPYPSA